MAYKAVHHLAHFNLLTQVFCSWNAPSTFPLRASVPKVLSSFLRVAFLSLRSHSPFPNNINKVCTVNAVLWVFTNRDFLKPNLFRK